MRQYVVPLIVFTYGLIAALFGYVIKMERRVGRAENWIEFVGQTAKRTSKGLERPTHMERDQLLRRFRGDEGPRLTFKEKSRLAEILEIIATREIDEIGQPNDAVPGDRLNAAINAATIRYEMGR